MCQQVCHVASRIRPSLFIVGVVWALGPLYTWGRIEGQPDHSYLGPIGSLGFIKSNARAFILRVGSNNHPSHVAS
jgi:hypothetical protein